MIVKRLGFTLLFVLVIAVLIGCAAPNNPTSVSLAPNARIFKLTMAYTEDSVWFRGLTRFSDLVKQRTNGRYAITIFPNASLASGSQAKEIEMVQNGQVDFSLSTTPYLAGIDPRFELLSLPWFFDSVDQMDQVLAGTLGEELLRPLEAKNLVGLGFAQAGFGCFYNSKREIKTPDDIKGLRIRVASAKVVNSTMKALGAVPVILSVPETYAALQNGVVDGVELSLDTFVTNKYYEVQKYASLCTYRPNIVALLASKSVWSGLDAETQKTLRQA
ncbi:MAG: TRAP transporter substrate-binding protein, partial [Anaerolineae bacterium]|nr:TRAP transporter substrate-binding protein [Anaerolineae bacterium]